MSLKIRDNGDTLPAQSVTEIPAIFRQFVTEKLADPGEIVADGEWRQFQTPGDLVSEKQGRKAGTVMLSADSMTGAYGSRRPGECAIQAVNFDLPADQRPTPEQAAANEAAARQQRQVREQETTDRAVKVWTASNPVPTDSGYFVARGVGETAAALPNCVRQHDNGTVLVAMKDGQGRLWNVERIRPDGGKLALEHGRTTGLGVWIPSRPTTGDFYICEGFAKALAIHHVTGLPALCCFSAGNMATAIREHAADLLGGIVAGDNDEAGRTAVTEAMRQYPDLRSVFPPAGAGDWNDLLVQQGKESLTLALQPPRSAGPDPLRREPPPPEPYPVEALGAVLAPAVEALARIIQAPPAMIAQSVLAAAAYCVQPHANVIIDGRVMPTSLYCISIGASGERKSAVDTQALKPISEKQRELVELYRLDAKLHKTDLRDFEKAEKELSKDRVVDLAAIRKNRDEKIAAIAAIGDPPEPPLIPNLLITEPTSEGIYKLYLSGQPSLGLFSDEGGLFLGGHAMQKETRLRTIATLSKLWDGRPIDRVRSGDGASVLYDRRLSLHLMMQPLVASELFTDQIYMDQGFLARVLCAWPESTAGHRRYVHADPAADPAMQRYWSVLHSLLSTPYPLRPDTRNELQPRLIPLSADAKRVWVAYADTIEAQLADGQPLETVRGFASKAAEHAARIAGVLALLQDGNTPAIGVAEVESGIALLDYYLTEALRLQAAGIADPDLQVADWLRQWCDGRDIVCLPDIYQRGPYGIRDSETARRIVNILVKHGWLIKVEGGAEIEGTRRKEAWRVVRTSI
jgi:phage/plasmid primase-like uncharacterized protein